MSYYDHTFLGITQSLCPECLALVQAKILQREGRVYFRKRCPVHGVREDFVSSDVRWFDRMEYNTPGKRPVYTSVEPARGCPFDCGLCTEHEQHTCIGLLEITSACNLQCPMCFAASGPGGTHLTFDQCRTAIDALVAAEGRAEVLQLSGGEPTIHPQFLEIFRYACDRPIDIVMINTNGIRLARDDAFLTQIAQLRHRSEVYLQFDGFDDAVYRSLRGESLVETKLRAIERLGQADLRVILVATLVAGLNEHEIGPIVDFGIRHPHITGVSFQPATYVGRYVLPEVLEQRVTMPDVIRAMAAHGGLWRESDFLPIPCAHPNEHSLAYAYRTPGGATPLTRFIEVENHIDLLANGITFTRVQARKLIEEFLSRQCCGGACDCGDFRLQIADFSLGDWRDGSHRDAHADRTATATSPMAEEFFRRALAEDLSPADVFRVTVTSFMDAYNFDVRQVMKACVHHVLPSGHIIPFSAYNVLYRDGHVPLPNRKPYEQYTRLQPDHARGGGDRGGTQPVYPA
jgi:uncharacterized radical SAM superfamily Fe-S cluster-containing enzyme